MRFKVLIFFSFYNFALNVCAQEVNQYVEQIIEAVAENAPEEFDYSELTEQLVFYRRRPLNLNRASEEQLKQLLFISPQQIQALLLHRQKNGPLIDLLELQAIDRFDSATIALLTPFCIAEENFVKQLSIRKVFEEARGEAILTYSQILQKQDGYLDHSDPEKVRYLGTPQRILTRYRYSYGNQLTAAVTMEKDPGEQFFTGSQRAGFDFYSGNISYRSDGVLAKFVVGDFSLQFGQGLGLWTGLGFGKSASITAVTKNNVGLKPYSSTNEALYLRGVSGTLKLRNLAVTPFLSHRAVDANVDTIGEASEVSSMLISGLHRTSTEVENRKALSQTIYGLNLQWQLRGLRLGTTGYRTQLQAPMKPGRFSYEAFEFSKSALDNLSAYYNYSSRNFYFFGELAHSMSSGFAYINGVSASLTPTVSLLLIHRKYERNYHSMFNQALSEGSVAANETGFYSGFSIHASKKLHIDSYVDFFKFPWLKFRVDAPSLGYEMLSQLTYSPSKKLKVILRYKFESKSENDGLPNTANFLAELSRRNYRFEVHYHISKSIQFRNRFERVDYEKESLKQSGYLLYQDIIYRPLLSRFSGNCRFAVFNTGGFESRLYAYENDVLYGFSFPAYQDRGARFYVNGRYRLLKNTDVSARYALSWYSQLTEIGAGLDRIDGNKKSDIKVQLRYQF